MWMLVESAALTAILTLTISKGKIFAPLRERLEGRFLGNLLSCPYCLMHWVAAGVLLGRGEFSLFSWAMVMVVGAILFGLTKKGISGEF